MKTTFATVLLLTLCISVRTTDDKNDAVFQVHNNYAAYQTLKNPIFNSENALEEPKQIPFTNPCICEYLKCSCCAGIRIIGFGFDRTACAELNYEPRASVLDLNIKLNDVSVFTNRISTHNRQVCVPVMPITLVGPFDICVRLYDMNVVEQRLHACLAMMGRVSQYPIVVLQFNCMEMGPGGVGLTRPIGGNYNESALYPSENYNITTSQTPQQDTDVFDPIVETAQENSTNTVDTTTK